MRRGFGCGSGGLRTFSARLNRGVHHQRLNGAAQEPTEGASLNDKFDHADADADAKGTHTTQYFEIFANRGTAELR